MGSRRDGSAGVEVGNCETCGASGRGAGGGIWPVTAGSTLDLSTAFLSEGDKNKYPTPASASATIALPIISPFGELTSCSGKGSCSQFDAELQLGDRNLNPNAGPANVYNGLDPTLLSHREKNLGWYGTGNGCDSARQRPLHALGEFLPLHETFYA